MLEWKEKGQRTVWAAKFIWESQVSLRYLLTIVLWNYFPLFNQKAENQDFVSDHSPFLLLREQQRKKFHLSPERHILIYSYKGRKKPSDLLIFEYTSLYEQVNFLLTLSWGTEGRDRLGDFPAGRVSERAETGPTSSSASLMQSRIEWGIEVAFHLAKQEFVVWEQKWIIFLCGKLQNRFVPRASPHLSCLLFWLCYHWWSAQ